MSKFAIECPQCGSINTASTFILSKKAIECGHCHAEINVKESRLISKVCPKCEKVFVFDQAKTAKRLCPSCGEKIDALKAATTEYRMKAVNCPQCACSVEIDVLKEKAFCPICNYEIIVDKELKKAKLVSDTGVSVIQYEGDNSTFVWKHPIEDFNLGSQLIVHESQEAIFFLNGQALDLFGPGRYTLETENLPVLKKIYSLPTGYQTPFHAEVYFINKTVQMGVKWGTDSRVRFIDPITNIPLDIGASGEMNLQVCDSKKLLVKLVGTTDGLVQKSILEATDDRDGSAHKSLQSFFRAPIMTEVKSYLAAAIKQQKLNVLEIDEKMGDLSGALREKIAPRFEEYGITIPEFYITNISLPEDDRNFKAIRDLISQAYIGVRSEEVKASVAEAARQRQIIEEQTKAQLEVIRAQGEAEASKTKGFAEAEVMRAQGYNQKDVLQADVQKAYAEGIGNMGSGSGGGGIATDLIGIVAGMKVAGEAVDSIGSVLGNSPAPGAAPDFSASSAVPNDTWTCSCGHAGNHGKFCEECGAGKAEDWTCACGHAGNRGKFCESCGQPKPTDWACRCGHSGNTGKFCAECGAKKPD